MFPRSSSTWSVYCTSSVHRRFGFPPYNPTRVLKGVCSAVVHLLSKVCSTSEEEEQDRSRAFSRRDLGHSVLIKRFSPNARPSLQDQWDSFRVRSPSQKSKGSPDPELVRADNLLK